MIRHFPIEAVHEAEFARTDDIHVIRVSPAYKGPFITPAFIKKNK